MLHEIEIFINNRDKIWNELREQRIIFDKEWRKKNINHQCKTKVYAYNGEWFCEHLTMARNRKFKDKLQEEENIMFGILNTLSKKAELYINHNK